MDSATTFLELSPLVRARIETAVQLNDPAAPAFVPAFYVSAGANIQFKVTSRGTGVRYLWRLNGRPIDGGKDLVLELLNVGSTGAGTYSVTIDEFGDRSDLDVATLTVVSDARLTHFSVHGHTGGGEQELSVGFFIAGAGCKRVLLRGFSPNLGLEGNAEGRAQTELVLYGWGGKVLASSRGNSDAAEVGKELVATLETGGYGVAIAGANETGGAVLQLGEADPDGGSASFSNISGRAYVGRGLAALAIGFTVAGTASATVLIRGVGPSLRGLFGLSDVAARTRLVLSDGDGRQVGANSRWGGGAALADAFARAGAFALPPASDDSALLITLPPGAYMAELDGDGGAAGVGLIEIYEVPAQ